MRTIRTALLIGLGTFGMFSLIGCGSDSEENANSGTLTTEQVQPVALRKAPTGEWRLPEPREGWFLVVLCRASNIDHLASSRQEGFRREDLVEALRGKLELKITGQLAAKREEFPRASAFDIISFLDAEIHQATDTATFGKSELVEVNSAAYAAYQLAEIKHADILAAIEERARAYADTHNWNPDQFFTLVSDAVAGLETAVGGNDNYVLED